MLQEIKDELLAKEKLNTISVLISRLTQEVIALNNEIHEITAILSRENTKDIRLANCPIGSEDYD